MPSACSVPPTRPTISRPSSPIEKEPFTEKKVYTGKREHRDRSGRRLPSRTAQSRACTIFGQNCAELRLSRDRMPGRDGLTGIARRGRYAGRLAQRRETLLRQCREAGRSSPNEPRPQAQAGQEHASAEDVQRRWRMRLLLPRRATRWTAGSVVRGRIRGVGPGTGWPRF